ncbi:hypothetical protein CBR_g40246 [Chara braunii]|uniref:Reverse transcriptase domain-containing protein n=1 Tax=Chara braunii TaxID=69332 RepID=A0A388K1R9_CHABU|nr:hypothetical protein CBR_g40246 [Chara braunii]|eukprot:GBG64000.1 hypothetical protein CBR_g40246 [Chara braunii]
MYVRIQVGQASCRALLDSGATRNFMSQSFMQRAGLGAQVRRKANPTPIKLADGKTQQLLDRYIEAVPVYFAPHACEPVTFDILDTDFDIILGMPWLASADHTVNFHRRTLSVRDAFGAEVVCTIPLPHSSIRCQVVTAKSFRATCAYEQPEEIGICFLRTVAVADSSPTGLSSDPRVVRLLDEFADIFESPTGVVPGRPISHEIILEAGVVPPKGCIYRMSEEELEKPATAPIPVLTVGEEGKVRKGSVEEVASPAGMAEHDAQNLDLRVVDVGVREKSGQQGTFNESAQRRSAKGGDVVEKVKGEECATKALSVIVEKERILNDGVFKRQPAPAEADQMEAVTNHKGVCMQETHTLMESTSTESDSVRLMVKDSAEQMYRAGDLQQPIERGHSETGSYSEVPGEEVGSEEDSGHSWPVRKTPADIARVRRTTAVIVAQVLVQTEYRQCVCLYSVDIQGDPRTCVHEGE